jgi:hypothetical protein
MTQKKIELLNEMSRIINNVTECNDNSDSCEKAGNIQDSELQPEEANDFDSRTLEKENNRR